MLIGYLALAYLTGRIDYTAIAHNLTRESLVSTMANKKKQLELRRIHHSPLFWVGAVLFLAAIAIYVFSDDLSWRPSAR